MLYNKELSITGAKESVQQAFYRALLTSSLVPIFIIEVALLILYFTINQAKKVAVINVSSGTSD